MSYYESPTNGIQSSTTPLLSKKHTITPINNTKSLIYSNTPTHTQTNTPKKLKTKPMKRIKFKSNTKAQCKSIPHITIHNHNSGGGIHNNYKYKSIQNNKLKQTQTQNKNIKTYKRQHIIDRSKQQPKKLLLLMDTKQSSDSNPVLMLPNIETAFNNNNKNNNKSITNGQNGNTKKRLLNRSKSENDIIKPHRKKRKILLSVPKCKIGDTMECLYGDENENENEWRLCSIIAVKNKGKNKGFLYYIHYTDYNRRLDQWVEGIKLRKPTGKIKKPSELLLENTNNKRLTRGQKRAVFEQHHIDIDDIEDDNNDNTNINNEDELYESIHLKTNKIKNIEKIQFGKYIIDCWYFSPYPEEYIGSTRLLYICEYCLKYMKFYNTYYHHINNECFIRHPPGNEIYRYDGISVWEIDGCIDKIYCQNLCLLAKLFFDHKTLYFDVSPFLFYIICEYDENGMHLVGYFSKEKNSPEGYNLACILTLPHKQKLGYGRFIINLSYELSKKESKIGSPEKPLSDLGKISYKSFWIENILQIIENYYGEITIKQISELTSFTKQDIIDSLKEVNMLNCYKGQHVIKYRAQSIKKYLTQFEKRRKKRKNIFHSQHLHWSSLKIQPKSHPWNGLSTFS